MGGKKMSLVNVGVYVGHVKGTPEYEVYLHEGMYHIMEVEEGEHVNVYGVHFENEKFYFQSGQEFQVVSN